MNMTAPLHMEYVTLKLRQFESHNGVNFLKLAKLGGQDFFLRIGE